MKVQTIQKNNNVSFQYSHKLKTMYKRGQLPSVIYGFYGETLEKGSETIEHLKLASSFKHKKDATTWNNIVLTNANENQKRGNKPLSEVIDFEAMGRYLEQFEAYSWGRKYIQGILKTVSELLSKGE